MGIYQSATNNVYRLKEEATLPRARNSEDKQQRLTTTHISLQTLLAG